jgi:alpha-aminoadipic semialdehyde synthase
MSGVVAIRRETKSTWERRAPLIPDAVRQIVSSSEVEILVQPSARRVFADKEYVRAGAKVTTELGDAKVILGVKEVPPELLQPETAYMFFSHVIKGQPYNMPMLQRLLDLKCTLIDYEMVTDDQGRRLIFFGRFAGLAGMIDTLSALGQRLQAEGRRTPLVQIEPAHTYESLEDARAAVRAAGDAIESEGMLEPIVIGVAGYGNVAKGAREIITELPAREVDPKDLPGLADSVTTPARNVYFSVFKEEHLVKPINSEGAFELNEYYQHPERYEGVFEKHLHHLTVLVNCIYWDERYPRLVRLHDVQELWSEGDSPRLRVIGDLGCDIGGAIECTVKTTEPGTPTYVYHPETGEISNGVDGHGPVVLAVDILPSELPREASEAFSHVLTPFVRSLASTDWSVKLENLAIPDELRRAIITHSGELTPDYRYLQAHLDRK